MIDGNSKDYIPISERNNLNKIKHYDIQPLYNDIKKKVIQYGFNIIKSKSKFKTQQYDKALLTIDFDLMFKNHGLRTSDKQAKIVIGMLSDERWITNTIVFKQIDVWSHSVYTVNILKIKEYYNIA